MTKVTITGEVWLVDQTTGHRRKEHQRIFEGLDVMKTETCKRWAIKTCTALARALDLNTMVVVSYYGQLDAPPHTAFQGTACGSRSGIIRRFGGLA